MVDSMNDMSMFERSNYHLTFGGLIEALLKADINSVFDKRITGIDSFRGYYSDIVLCTEKEGLRVYDEEYIGEYKDYDKWYKEHNTHISKLPSNANELGELLKSIIGKDFKGYKGGNFTITEDKPLWLGEDSSDSSGPAVIGISDDLVLITKEIK